MAIALKTEYPSGSEDFQPGEKWSYSNLGYVTLGILIHKVSGEFWGDFLQQRVFGPLGMKHTSVISEADILLVGGDGPLGLEC